MTLQAKSSLKYPPHQWFDIQKSGLAKERQTQRSNFRRAHPHLVAPLPVLSPDDLEDPAKTIVPPSDIFAASWTATLSKVGSIQGTSCWRQTPERGPAPHLIPPRPGVKCSSTGEIYLSKSPAQVPFRVSTAPDLKMVDNVLFRPRLYSEQRVAGIPMQAGSP
ncbi:unnamed protein product [Durusdinium trenchii]|uniref:Uncharacterized protein n=1 Tax=Durusdinium trenchii TaxID=1381693 RepID=A0ABP0RGZ6_9DINO